ncbi:hypothetical protein SAMN05661093_02264 [Kibdelosporangium aridum]|uniref:Uncharacterized protein n=1 Tax=Kibdelosporangium aridum TaxID=2030 RepID=A0A1W2CKF9_KIBAR|nr:hypothetical protein SAMN05661093_02264 [Kibdelosporangium aridum]
MDVVTLVKKGSRYLDVDGVTYRWRLRGRPTYSQANAWWPLTFAVELADDPGTTLVVTTNQAHPSNWMGVPSRPVLPGHVARAVRTALAEGWQPANPGKPFMLDQSAGFTAP